MFQDLPTLKPQPALPSDKPNVYRSDASVENNNKHRVPSIYSTKYTSLWREKGEAPQMNNIPTGYPPGLQFLLEKKMKTGRRWPGNPIRPQRKTYEKYFRDRKLRRSKRDDCSARIESLAADFHELSASEEVSRRRKRDLPGLLHY